VPPVASGTDPFVLIGRVVTMDDADTVVDRGAVYVQGDSIAHVLDATDPAPAGFETAERIDTHGTIYPGLIELHNHLSYDVLPLWAVPKEFASRDGWSKGPVYRGTISGPMHVLGMTAGMGEAVVRYVEAKCLLGGTTTSQGIALAGDAGIQKYYFGAIRNVEETKDKALHDAATRIADVEAEVADKFLKRLNQSSCLLLHLSEGKKSDTRSHDHFMALHQPDDSWAITSHLAGIHCVALTKADFGVMAARQASMVWSPVSNLLLYGETADVGAAREEGVKIGIGSDWSPSGSKNVLFELRVASVVAAGAFSHRELLAMATRTAAAILGWQKIGSIVKTNRADLLVVADRSHDAHEHLFTCRETDVNLVVIDGVARAGTRSLMDRFAFDSPTETVKVGSTSRVVFLAQKGVDPAIANLTLGAATDRLEDALHRLPELAKKLESPTAAALPRPQISLVLDHDEMPGLAQRPHLPGPDGQPTGELAPDLTAAASKPLSELVKPMNVDPRTVVDDADFIEVLTAEMNLPKAVSDGIKAL
jgi:cytosine/adenosine deaminase-related metal-dependent hydrolase